MSETNRAIQLKEEGNRCFQQGNYAGAEGLYSKALIADPKNQAIYTNRAMARLKLKLWDAVIVDCQDALALNPESMKASYYLSQAQLELRNFDDAVSAALRAHALCIKTADRSLTAVTGLVLRCKKERWEHKERVRMHQSLYLEEETLEVMIKARNRAVEAAESEAERAELAVEWDGKVEELKRVFEASRSKEEQRREVPDWVVDDISFGIMVDPVITKTGKSYERATIMEHLRRQPIDPLTREPLLISELRPNLALRQACEEFLDENGWAVDW